MSEWKWEPKYGPAFLTGIAQLIMMLVVGTALWTNLQNDVKAANSKIETLDKVTGKLLDLTTTQQNEIVKASTAIDYIVPSLKRIEDTVNTIARK